MRISDFFFHFPVSLLQTIFLISMSDADPPVLDVMMKEVKLTSAPPSPSPAATITPPAPPEAVNPESEPTSQLSLQDRLTNDYLNPTLEQAKILKENPYEYYKATKSQGYDALVSTSATLVNQARDYSAPLAADLASRTADLRTAATQKAEEIGEKANKMKEDGRLYVANKTTGVVERVEEIRVKTKDSLEQSGKLISAKTEEIRVKTKDSLEQSGKLISAKTEQVSEPLK